MGEERRYVTIDDSRTFEAESPHQRFDRIAFTMRALDLLRPSMTVAVYERNHRMSIDRGLDLSRRDGSQLAVLGVPRHASREQISYALVELAGHEPSPLLIAALVRAAAPE